MIDIKDMEENLRNIVYIGVDELFSHKWKTDKQWKRLGGWEYWRCEICGVYFGAKFSGNYAITGIWLENGTRWWWYPKQCTCSEIMMREALG